MYVSCGKENTTLCSSSTREFARKENEAAYIYIYTRRRAVFGRQRNPPANFANGKCMHACEGGKQTVPSL
jgi:hypothetical protein